jgi:hypothetical protein
VNRTDFVAALAAATAPGSPAPNGTPITAEIQIRRDAVELLAPFSVTIALRNPTARIVGLDFPTADIYRIDVRRDDQTVWSTATGHKPLQVARRVDVVPGLTRLASQIIDGTTDDRRAYAPGNYVVRVALLGSELNTSLTQTITFPPPIPIADARRTTGGTVVTIAGVPRNDAGVSELSDASGSLRLSRPLGLHPTGAYVVRGYLDALGDDVQFAVGRFAPAYDNVDEARAKPPA